MKTCTIIGWISRVAAAVILLQTLLFKFTAAPESVYIFTKVGLEPWGRIGSGITELIAAILILIPATTWLGAGLALAVMAGAIFSHLTVIGIVVMMMEDCCLGCRLLSPLAAPCCCFYSGGAFLASELIYETISFAGC